MVAKNIALPNIRSCFIPDPGHIIVDADLAGADAQVVAWEAGDEDLKAAFKKGLKIHCHNARAMWPEKFDGATDDEIKAEKEYKLIKGGVHGTNYGAHPSALVHNLGWTFSFASEFQERWFDLHPPIREWHKRTDRILAGEQCWKCYTFAERPGQCQICGEPLGKAIGNRFGFRIVFTGRLDKNTKNEALAWVPQSTVALVTELAQLSIMGELAGNWPRFGNASISYNWHKYIVNPTAWKRYSNVVQFLAQVHDSLVFQIPEAYADELESIVNSLEVIVPYNDPLIIPWGYGASYKSWGEIE